MIDTDDETLHVLNIGHWRYYLSLIIVYICNVAVFALMNISYFYWSTPLVVYVFSTHSELNKVARESLVINYTFILLERT